MSSHIYRESRNIERSFIDYITTQLALATPPWTGISVEKVFPIENQVPCILVQLLSTSSEDLEIGSTEKRKYPLVILRIFADNDGQRLDLADWLFDIIKSGFVYNNYTITDNEPAATPAGKIHISRFIRNEKELENIEGLKKIDRYRHIISVEITVS